MTHPVFAGDTLYSESMVLEKRESATARTPASSPSRTRGLNQDGDEVCSFKRTFYVYKRGAEQLEGDLPRGQALAADRRPGRGLRGVDADHASPRGARPSPSWSTRPRGRRRRAPRSSGCPSCTAAPRVSAAAPDHAATSSARVGTAIALAFTRSPMVTALEALDLDELSRRPLRARARHRRAAAQRGLAQRALGQAGRPPARDRPQHPHFVGTATTGEPMTLEGEFEPMQHPRLRAALPGAAHRDPDLPRRDGPRDDPARRRDRRRLDQPRAVLAGLPRRADPARDRRRRRGGGGRTRDRPRPRRVRRAARSTPTATVARRRAAGLVGFYATRAHLRRLLRLPRPRRGPAAGRRRLPRRHRRREPRRPRSPTAMVDALTLAARATRSPSRSRPTTAWPTRSSSARPPTVWRRTADPRRARTRSSPSSPDHRRSAVTTPCKPLEDIRIIARRAVRRRPVRQRAPGRPRRGGHQDRGPDASAATSGATCRRTPRARTRCSSRPSTATSESLSLDLTTPAGREVFEDLVEGQRRRLLQPARRRAGEARHHLRRPQAPEPARSCACSLTGFGMTGPRHARSPATTTSCRAWPAGWTSPASPTARRPSPGCRWSTTRGGFVAAISLLAGVHAARRDGVGMDCDVSLYDTAIGDADLSGDLAPQRRLRARAHPPLRAPVAGAVPGVPGQGRLDGRRLRQGEVLAAAAPRSSSTRSGPSRPAVRARSPTATAAPRGAAAAARGDLRDAHRRRVARQLYAGVDPVRADQRRRRGAGRGAHRRPRPDRRDRAPALRHGQASSPRRCGSATSRPSTAARRSATRTSTTSSPSCSATTPPRSPTLRGAGRVRRRHPTATTALSEPPRDDRRELAAWASATGRRPRARCARRRPAPRSTASAPRSPRRATAPPRPPSTVARRARRPARGDRPRHRRPVSARRRPRWPTARWCTRSTSTTPTPAGWCTPRRSCCPRRSPSASRSGRRGREVARRGGGRLRGRVPGRRRRAARVPRPRPARHARSRGVFSAARSPRGCCGSTGATTVDALGIAGSQAGGLLEFLAHRRVDQAAAPRLGRRRRASSPPGSPRPAPPARRRCSTARTASTPRSPARTADPALVIDGLGERWETTRIGIKPYPACQLMHATLDASATRSRRAIPSRPTSSRSIVEVHPDSRRDRVRAGRDLAAPRTSYAAKFSLPWSVAALLVDGGSASTPTTSSRLARRPEVAALAAGPRHLAGSPGDRRRPPTRPAGSRSRSPTARRSSGRSPAARGGPDDPLDRRRAARQVPRATPAAAQPSPTAVPARRARRR